MIIPGVVAHASRPVPVITTGAATNTTTVPTVTTSPATNYNQNSATLNGSTSTGTLSFLWGTTTNPTTALASSSLTGLSNGTTYYFRARGTNNSATASLSGTVTTTSPVTISFEWGTVSGVYPNVASVGTYSNVTTQSVSASISGLTPGTTYYYRIRSTTTTGVFIYGTENSFTATNSVVNGSVLSFTTYQFRSVTYTTVGTQTWLNPTPTNGAPINTLYNVVLIGGGSSGNGDGGSSGQGRVVQSFSISGNQTVVVGAGGSLSNYYVDYGAGGSSSVGSQTAIGGSDTKSGDNHNRGTTWVWDGGFNFDSSYAYGGGGGAGGPGTAGNGVYVGSGPRYDLYGGNGGPANTLSWTGIDGTARSYAYGGGGAGATYLGYVGRLWFNGVAGGYGGAIGVAGTNGRGGGGGGGGTGGSVSADGGSGYVYFEYWGP